MSRHESPTHIFAPPKLPATLRLGAVHLTVSDLERSVDFYEDAIGLRLHHREDGVAAMGVGEEDLLVLYEELAHAKLRLEERQTPIQGASDHGTHEAIMYAGRGLSFSSDRGSPAAPPSC
jgi:catechol 2,3-dioxygenase